MDLPDKLPREFIKATPILAAATLIGAGLALRTVRPKPLDLPEPDKTTPHFDSGKSKKVRKARDRVARFLPSNMAHSIGNSLLAIGGAVTLLRILDEIVEDDERLF